MSDSVHFPALRMMTMVTMVTGGGGAPRITVTLALTSEPLAEGHSSHWSLRRSWLRLPEAWFSVTCSQKHSLRFKY